MLGVFGYVYGFGENTYSSQTQEPSDGLLEILQSKKMTHGHTLIFSMVLPDSRIKTVILQLLHLGEH